MRSISFVRIFASAFFAVLFLSISSFDVNAQGRGKGGDRGDRQQNSDGRNKANDRGSNRGREEQARSDQRSREQQVRSDRNSRRQQDSSDQNSRRQQEYSDRNSRQQQIRSDRESRRQQEYSDRNSRQQQIRSDQNSRRQQEYSDQNSRQQQIRSDRESRRQQEYSDQYSRQRGSRNDRSGNRDLGLWAGYDYERSRRARSDDRRDDRYDRDYRSNSGRKNERARWNRSYSGTPVWANRNYDRPAWNRYERDQRKYQKEVYKDYRKHQRGRYYAGWNRYDTHGERWNGGYVLYGAPYYQTYVYRGRNLRRSDRYYDQSRSYQRYPNYKLSYYGPVYYQGIDRSYLNDDQYGYYYDDHGYADNGNWKDVLLRTVIGAFIGGQGSQYDRDVYYSRDYQTISYLPYRNGGPQYYGQQPLYSTYTYRYSDYDGDSDAYGYDPYGRSYDDYSGIDPILMNISGSGSGTYLNEMLGRAVASGYQQGLADGLYAREQGWNDQYYRDPYSYENSNYAYGSCSTSLAENRQLLSSGYELGYRDALSESNSVYYQDRPQGVDLVSLLLSNVLRVGA